MNGSGIVSAAKTWNACKQLRCGNILMDANQTWKAMRTPVVKDHKCMNCIHSLSMACIEPEYKAKEDAGDYEFTNCNFIDANGNSYFPKWEWNGEYF